MQGRSRSPLLAPRFSRRRPSRLVDEEMDCSSPSLPNLPCRPRGGQSLLGAVVAARRLRTAPAPVARPETRGERANQRPQLLLSGPLRFTACRSLLSCFATPGPRPVRPGPRVRPLGGGSTPKALAAPTPNSFPTGSSLRNPIRTRLPPGSLLQDAKRQKKTAAFLGSSTKATMKEAQVRLPGRGRTRGARERRCRAGARRRSGGPTARPAPSRWRPASRLLRQ
jgi:hypothetical protein